jgi:hypothetical protein
MGDGCLSDIQKTSAGLTRDSKIRLAEIRKNIMDSGLLEMYVQMGLTGREYFVNPETHQVEMSDKDDTMISQPERLKIMSMLVNKVLPAVKDMEEQQEQKGLLESIAKKINADKEIGSDD